jgi:hypothetical protein
MSMKNALTEACKSSGHSLRYRGGGYILTRDGSLENNRADFNAIATVLITHPSTYFISLFYPVASDSLLTSQEYR